MQKTKVFRMHIRPRGGLKNQPLSFAFCLRESVLGMGWPIGHAGKRSLSWNEYEAAGIKQYGSTGISRVRFLQNNVRPGHLIWTRDTNGKYYLARVMSGWEYSERADNRNADIVNFVRCDIKPVPGVDQVPGKVIACFRPSRTIQSVRHPAAANYSRLLWNQLAGEEVYTVSPPQREDLFSYLDDEATEDLVFLFLQRKGWLVLPLSRKADTMAYEYILIHQSTYDRAIVQVKTGTATINVAPFADYEEIVFVFQPNQRFCGGTMPQNVVTIDSQELREFAVNNRELLPRSVMLWLDKLQEERQ